MADRDAKKQNSLPGMVAVLPTLLEFSKRLDGHQSGRNESIGLSGLQCPLQFIHSVICKCKYLPTSSETPNLTVPPFSKYIKSSEDQQLFLLQNSLFCALNPYSREPTQLPQIQAVPQSEDKRSCWRCENLCFISLNPHNPPSFNPLLKITKRHTFQMLHLYIWYLYLLISSNNNTRRQRKG